MPDRHLIDQMLLDISTTKQLRKTVEDLDSNELNVSIQNQVGILKNWINLKKNKSKSQLFTGRIPLGTVLKKNKKLDSCYVLQNPKSEIRPAINQFVLVYDPKYDEIISGVVDNFKTYTLDDKDALVIIIDLLFVHTDTTLNKRRQITQLVSDECIVFSAKPEEIELIFGLPVEGVRLGICSHNKDLIETKIGGPLYYKLHPDLLKTHMMIGGVTGQGKTIFLKNMIYELATHEFRVSTNMTVFDLQGDLVQILEPMMKEVIPKRFKQDYKDLGVQNFHGLKEKIINQDILFLKPFYVEVHGFLEMFPWVDFGLDSKNIKTAEELVSLVPGLTDKGAQTLSQLYSMFMGTQTEEFRFADFYDFVVNGLQKTEKGRKKYLWETPDGSDSVRTRSTTGDAMIRQLKSFNRLDVFDKVPEIDMRELLDKRLVFIYFPDHIGYTQIRSIMLLDILTRIYSIKRHEIDLAVKNNLIVIDEAHELLPRKKRTSDLSDQFFNFIEKRFTRIAKEGRKYGISLVVSSQILSELNDEVKFNAQTRVYFKLSTRDLKSLDMDRETKSLINGLRKGYAVVYSRDNLDIGRALEIKVLPPIFLHCDPRIADFHYKNKVETIKRERD